MVRLLKRCLSCRRYTIGERCPSCGGEVASPHPPKFSLDDKYLLYRSARRYAQGKEQAEARAA